MQSESRGSKCLDFLRTQSPFPLGSYTEQEFVLRKPSRVKIMAYKGRGLQDAASHNTCRSKERTGLSGGAHTGTIHC